MCFFNYSILHLFSHILPKNIFFLQCRGQTLSQACRACSLSMGPVSPPLLQLLGGGGASVVFISGDLFLTLHSGITPRRSQDHLGSQGSSCLQCPAHCTVSWDPSPKIFNYYKRNFEAFTTLTCKQRSTDHWQIKWSYVVGTL